MVGDLFNSLTAIRVPARMKKMAVVLFLGRYVTMAGTIVACIDCFLCVVSGDLVFFASVSDRKLLAKLNNFGTQNGASSHVVVATSVGDRRVWKELLRRSCCCWRYLQLAKPAKIGEETTILSP
jgi:hypothetical protein